jgi:hypothetical protein
VNANHASGFPPGTLEFLFEHTKGVPDLQVENGDALDGKAAQLFAAGSVVLGLSATSGSLSAYLLVAAVGAYMVVIGGSFWCLWSRRWRVLQHVDVLWNQYYDMTPDQPRQVIIDEASKAYIANRDVLRSKRRGLFVAFAATATETLMIGVAVAIAAF